MGRIRRIARRIKAAVGRRQLGEDMLQWHGGGGSMVYAVGSHLMGGHEIPPGYAEKAGAELEAALSTTDQEDIQELKSVIDRLRSLISEDAHPLFGPDGSLDEFTRQYVITALWSSGDDSDPSGHGENLDEKYDPQDIDPKSMQSMIEDCAKFQKENAADIGDKAGLAGHDFWLTRNGHGSGFWDGDWPELAAARLTEASKAFGEVTLSVSDDGKIFIV